jgi:hypothetical protein
MAGGVDAVDADVPQRAAAGLAAQTNATGLRLHREQRIERSRIPEGSGVDGLDRPQVGAFEVEAVSDHEPDVVPLRRSDHVFGFLFTQRHGLFAQHVLARVRRHHRVPMMQMVGQCDVDRVEEIALERLFQSS